MTEPSPEEIAAFAARHGLAALTPAQLARMAVLARTVAEAAAGLSRVTDKFVEPMPVFRVRG
ncbi:hypothetical protein ACFQY5_31900 [Paeniroseomonas aquatica]|uniref:DUF4089 domain-containing protein n=1 Tax=Paeniroseomonas aquatica TaxID=373043 RepID=A0ABT8AAA1_9PROT|nr:hypothetical protein [Paeniroseomonas aquatica]MDN3566659.1 hypothetical protein [Paeniroseomonas aquatica]